MYNELALSDGIQSTDYQEYWMGRKYCLCEGYDCILGLFGMHVCTHYVYNICVFTCVCTMSCVYVYACIIVVLGRLIDSLID